MNNFSGINEDGLDNICLNFYNNIEIVKKNFDNIIEIVENLETSFQSDSGEEFRKKIENMKLVFDIAQNKLTNYANELSNVKLKYRDFSQDLSINIKNSEDKLSDNIKEI